MLISSLSSSFCSALSLASQASLSNLAGVVSGTGWVATAAVGEDAGTVCEDAGSEPLVPAATFGEEKKDVMDLSCFTFFAASAVMSAALRLRDIMNT